MNGQIGAHRPDVMSAAVSAITAMLGLLVINAERLRPAPRCASSVSSGECDQGSFAFALQSRCRSDGT